MWDYALKWFVFDSLFFLSVLKYMSQLLFHLVNTLKSAGNLTASFIHKEDGPRLSSEVHAEKTAKDFPIQ